jgi:hypothetical protein
VLFLVSSWEVILSILNYSFFSFHHFSEPVQLSWLQVVQLRNCGLTPSRSTRCLSPTQHPTCCMLGSLSMAVQQSNEWSWPSPSPSIKIKNGWSYTFTPPHALMVCTRATCPWLYNYTT